MLHYWLCVAVAFAGHALGIPPSELKFEASILSTGEVDGLGDARKRVMRRNPQKSNNALSASTLAHTHSHGYRPASVTANSSINANVNSSILQVSPPASNSGADGSSPVDQSEPSSSTSSSFEQWTRTFAANLVANSNPAGPTPSERQHAREYFYASHPLLLSDSAFDPTDEGETGETLTQTVAAMLPDATAILHGDLEDGGPQLQGDMDVLLGSNTGWEPLVAWFKKHPEGRPLVQMEYFDYRADSSKRHGVNITAFYGAKHGHDGMLGEKWSIARLQMKGRTFTMLAGSNENWGWFSTWYPNRTAHWRETSTEFRDNVETFLDSPEVNLVFHRQHCNFTHPKIVPLPLSTKESGLYGDPIFAELSVQEKLNVPKSAWLGMFSSGWSGRAQIFNASVARFGSELVTIQSTNAGQGHPHQSFLKKETYLSAMRSDRFQICPSGLGADCYCIWESQRVGTIPIVERGFGFDRLFTRLPVLMVNSYDELSLGFLQAIYPFYVKHAGDFLWEAHTHKFWVQMMKTATARDAAKEFPFPALPPFVRPSETPCRPGTHFGQVDCHSPFAASPINSPSSCGGCIPG